MDFKKYTKLRCRVCGGNFLYNTKALSTGKNKGTYCSIKCKSVGMSKIKQFKHCIMCDNKIVCKRSSFFKKRPTYNRFCSIQCSATYKKVNNRIEVKCLTCNKSYYVQKWRTKTGCGYYCSVTCRRKSPVIKEKLRKRQQKLWSLQSYASQIMNQKKATSIEKKLYQELQRRGLLFETQKVIGNRFIVDAYIPSLNLIIEADGDYWHSLPKVVSKDKRENAYIKKCGYNILRISERDFNNKSYLSKIERSVN